MINEGGCGGGGGGGMIERQQWDSVRVVIK